MSEVLTIMSTMSFLITLDFGVKIYLPILGLSLFMISARIQLAILTLQVLLSGFYATSYKDVYILVGVHLN